MRLRMFPLLAALAMPVGLVGCGATPGVNTTGTATNQAQQVVAALYGTYTGAAAGELSWMSTTSNPSKVTVAKVEDLRKKAYADLKALEVSANAGEITTAKEVLAKASMQALLEYMASQKIPTSA